MDRGVESKRKFKSIVSSVKRINDDPNGLKKNSFEGFKEDLGLDSNAKKRNINDFTSKIKGKSQGTKDIFTDILDTVEGVLGTEKEDLIESQKKPYIQSKLLRYAKQAAQKAIDEGKQMVTDEVKKGYFEGQGGCNSNTQASSTSYSISPKQFDFINMLKVAPTSVSGKIMYEAQPDPGIGIQFNRELYSGFDGTPYDFDTKNGDNLFSMTWDSGSQKYLITVPSNTTVSDFIDDYYDSIEQPNIESVLKNAMMLALQGDGTEAQSFTVGVDFMNRLCSKLFRVCGNAEGFDSPFLQDATKVVQEDEVDIQDYFDFDDPEGIDIDDEDARLRRVLKFRDCNNFEIPINPNHIEDFSYLLGTKTIDENVNDTLKKSAVDAYEESDNSVYLEGFEISLSTTYLQQIPKALVANVLSPKMLFPVALSYDMLYDEALEVKDMMKELSGTFFNIIKRVFWTFIQEFWNFVKKDLLDFVKDVALTIVLNRVKKIKDIILILIKLLLKVLEFGIQSCAEFFDTILRVIQAALNRSVNIPVPGLLLVLSEALPGFSSDRAYMDALQRMEDAGINTGDIYGTENKLPSMVKSMIDAYSSEMDTNSYVKIALKPTVIPAGPGGAVISPLITGNGKVF